MLTVRSGLGAGGERSVAAVERARPRGGCGGSPRLRSAVDFQKRANHTEGRIARGGMLAVAGERLTFTPHRLERSLDAAALDVPLTDVVEVGAEPRSWRPFDGGMRTRLRVVLASGERHLFVVNGLEELIHRLRAAVDEAGR
jgi:hypothetical protein